MTKKEIHVHQLTGCRPTPLAHYLKALGILRLVASDPDPNARGWWKDDVFHLATILDRDALESYLLNDYSPTPLLAPWNGGSGFYPKDNKIGIDGIANSIAPRFENYRSPSHRQKQSPHTYQQTKEKGLKRINLYRPVGWFGVAQLCNGLMRL